MYKKYFVYVDDNNHNNHSVHKIAVPADCEDGAKFMALRLCIPGSEVIAVKDATEEYPISAKSVYEALDNAGFIDWVSEWICRALTGLGIAE